MPYARLPGLILAAGVIGARGSVRLGVVDDAILVGVGAAKAEEVIDGDP